MASSIDFAALFDLAPNPYMVVDSGLRYVAANAAYLEVTATTLETLRGRHVFEAFPNDPADPNNVPAQLLRKSFERVLATGERDHLAILPYRVPQKLADGTVTEVDRYWSATHVPLRDAAGKVTHIMQHTVDITALHTKEAAPSTRPEQPGATGGEMRDAAGVLHRARAVQEENVRLGAATEELRGLFAQAPGFIAVLDGTEHVFRMVNESYVRLVGKRDLVGKSVKDALPEVVEQGFIQILDTVRNSGQPFIGEGVRILLDRDAGGPASEAFLDFIYQPVRNVSGAVTGIFVQGHDVTARRQAEREGLEARRAAEAFAEELVEQSKQVAESLAAAQRKIAELEAKVAVR